jgi:hypothetical protein
MSKLSRTNFLLRRAFKNLYDKCSHTFFFSLFHSHLLNLPILLIVRLSPILIELFATVLGSSKNSWDSWFIFNLRKKNTCYNMENSSVRIYKGKGSTGFAHPVIDCYIAK